MVELRRLEASDREQFISDNQEAFNYGALEEFGCRDDHFEEDGQIISRETIERAIDEGEAYRIISDGTIAGGAVIKIQGERGHLDLLFVSPGVHSKGIGYAAWREIEKLHPEVTIWETVTPYFEKRNIHFYVNRCGFHIVEFYNSHHPDPNDPDMAEQADDQFEDGMFRFEKRIKVFVRKMKTINVVAAIIRDNGRIFATQRGYGAFKDRWEFPGGKIEPGETSQQAIVREIREELGVEIEEVEYFYTVEYDYPDFHLNMQCFLCRILSGEPVLREHEAARWMGASDMWSVEWLPADVEVVKEIIDSRLIDAGR